MSFLKGLFQQKICFFLELGKLNFTDAFKLAITELPEEYDPTSLGAYTTFVGEFGTHYAKRSTMGARYGKLSFHILRSL